MPIPDYQTLMLPVLRLAAQGERRVGEAAEAIAGAGKGVFVTTSSFSARARDFVRHLSQRVILLDGPTLADLMIEHGVGVRTIQTVALKRLDEDFFAEDG